MGTNRVDYRKHTLKKKEGLKMKPGKVKLPITPARLAELRAEMRRRLEDSSEAFENPPKPPRYDEVFLNGVQTLNEEATEVSSKNTSAPSKHSTSRQQRMHDTALAWANAAEQQEYLPRSIVQEAEAAHLAAIKDWAVRKKKQQTC